MPGLVKIGRSSRTPEERARELSSVSGIPTPFFVLYSVYVEDAEVGERRVHARLEASGYRESSNREFFRLSNQVAVDVLASLPNQKKPEPRGVDLGTDESLDELVSELFRTAQGYRYGIKGFAREPDLAAECYLKLLALGEETAAIDLAELYLTPGVPGRPNKADLSRARKYALRALKVSDESCEVLADLAMEEGNHSNFYHYYGRFLDWVMEEVSEHQRMVIDDAVTARLRRGLAVRVYSLAFAEFILRKVIAEHRVLSDLAFELGNLAAEDEVDHVFAREMVAHIAKQSR